MTDNLSGTLVLLDVGHGNCAVLFDTNGTVVFDAGPKNGLLEFLEPTGIRRIDAVLVSHADEDHIGGLIGLLSSGEYEIGEVRLNSDAAKLTRVWSDLLWLLDQMQGNSGLVFEPSLTRANTGLFGQGDVEIEVLAPSGYLAARGPGSEDRMGRRIGTNTISAVIRLVKDDEPIALLTGDLDDVGLDNLVEANVNASAPLLVFPHHGGQPGVNANPAEFTQRLYNVGPCQRP